MLVCAIIQLKLQLAVQYFFCRDKFLNLYKYIDFS